MSALTICLLLATPQGGDTAQGAPPHLPAPLAWLVDQAEAPMVSRHLVVLEPGADAPTLALARPLYCFDAADLQEVAWCGDLLHVNGPRPPSRPAPHASMPLHALARGEHACGTRAGGGPGDRPSSC